ncbi:MAG: hypothetical protein WAK55_19740, partial [Xanthobacteraceae bacterium]
MVTYITDNPFKLAHGLGERIASSVSAMVCGRTGGLPVRVCAVPAIKVAMLEQFSDPIRTCYERAAKAKANADATNDAALKAEFLASEDRWLTLARSFEFTESLEDFTTANSERRKKFDERLRANMDSAPGIPLAGSA